MPLTPQPLADSLAANWLADGSDRFPANPAESADAFSRVVADWFQGATAMGTPVLTAQATRPKILPFAIAAFMSNDANAAGTQLATGLSIYLTLQQFGIGISQPPLATGLGIGVFSAVFATLPMETDVRASLMATAILTMTVSTIVAAPPFIYVPIQ